MKTITNITYPAFALFAFAWFALSATAWATCQKGCLPHGNTALGDNALINNTSLGVFNTAIGSGALYSNIFGEENTAIGEEALFSNMGSFNTATGSQALELNTTGNYNTAYGSTALFSNTTGNYNVALGFFAGENITTGSNNIATGNSAGINLTTGSNNIDIGNQGIADESNTIRIGTQDTQTDTYVAGVWQAIVTGIASPVRVNSSGKLGTAPSSARFKDVIKPMDKASEAILALKPVTFRYKKELDPKGAPQFGLVAEEVAKVNPDLVVLDEQGKPFTVRYEEVNAMLLNEFLKEHRKNEEREATIAELKSIVAQQQKDFQATAAHQQKQIEALTAGLQKVSARIEVIKPAHQTVLNRQ